jgi:pimeloyl-ACP methyl ester carboxylesterase
MPDLIPDREGFVAGDGHRIHYEYFGRGVREAICLLNGLAMHTKAWYGFLPRLLPDLDVILYDYPGQGTSSADDVPYRIPRLAAYLSLIADELGIHRFHLMGISYGGFVALDFARQFQARLHTMTLSGILLSHEVLFQMYQDLSLRFYRAGPEAFELYTHYMYEKIFGEAFVRVFRDQLEPMRAKFHDRYKDRAHALIRLTEAQDPFFGDLDANLPGYRAIRTPTLVMAGAQDRAIPPWVQEKLADVLPNARFDLVEDSGHVVYLEKPDVFFGRLLAFTKAKSVDSDVRNQE